MYNYQPVFENIYNVQINCYWNRDDRYYFKNGEKPPMIKDDLNVMKWFKDQLKVICPKNKIIQNSKVYTQQSIKIQYSKV